MPLLAWPDCSCTSETSRFMYVHGWFARLPGARCSRVQSGASELCAASQMRRALYYSAEQLSLGLH